MKTDRLSSVGVRSTITSDCLNVVTQCVELVGVELQLFWLPFLFTLLRNAWLRSTVVFLFLFIPPLSSFLFSLQFLSEECVARLLFEFTEAVTKRRSDFRHYIQCRVYVHSEFRKTMEVCKIKKELQEACVVWLREEVLKDWYCALH